VRDYPKIVERLKTQLSKWQQTESRVWMLGQVQSVKSEPSFSLPPCLPRSHSLHHARRPPKTNSQKNCVEMTESRGMGLTAGVGAGGVARIQFFAPSWVKKATGRGKLCRRRSASCLMQPRASCSLVPHAASCLMQPRASCSLVQPRASYCLVPKAAWYIVEWRRLVGSEAGRQGG